MVTLLQFAHYALHIRGRGSTPGEYAEQILACTTGNSKGIITALVTALSDSWVSFLQNSLKAVLVIQSIGARTGLKFVSSGMENDCLLKPEGILLQ